MSVMDAFEELAPPSEIYTLDEVVEILRKETDAEQAIRLLQTERLKLLKGRKN